MKTTKRRPKRDFRSDAGNRNELQIREVRRKEEVAEFDELLNQEHYIGQARPAGDFLRQEALLDGEGVGLLAWGAACYALKDRDEWIGWNNTMRAERQKLIVQNRRFLLLKDKGEEPNLASQILGAAVRALPENWEQKFGYRPVLGETFTDIELHEGTCYKAVPRPPAPISRPRRRFAPGDRHFHQGPWKSHRGSSSRNLSPEHCEAPAG